MAGWIARDRPWEVYAPGHAGPSAIAACTLRRRRGSMLFSAVIGILIILGLIAGVMTLIQQARSASLLRDRVNQIALVTAEIQSIDRDGSMEILMLSDRIRQGQFGILDERLVEAGAYYSAGTENGAKRVYLNFADKQPHHCRKMQQGLTDNGSGLHGGWSPLFGRQVVIRCSFYEDGRARTEVRVPYSDVETFMRGKGF